MTQTQKASCGAIALLVAGVTLGSCATASGGGMGAKPIDCQASCATSHDSCMNHYGPLSSDSDPPPLQAKDGEEGTTVDQERSPTACTAALQDCLGSCRS